MLSEREADIDISKSFQTPGWLRFWAENSTFSSRLENFGKKWQYWYIVGCYSDVIERPARKMEGRTPLWKEHPHMICLANRAFWRKSQPVEGEQNEQEYSIVGDWFDAGFALPGRLWH
jgi:hypothetical protein